jgi:hypothetical protein
MHLSLLLLSLLRLRTVAVVAVSKFFQRPKFFGLCGGSGWGKSDKRKKGGRPQFFSAASQPMTSSDVSIRCHRFKIQNNILKFEEGPHRKPTMDEPGSQPPTRIQRHALPLLHCAKSINRDEKIPFNKKAAAQIIIICTKTSTLYFSTIPYLQ